MFTVKTLFTKPSDTMHKYLQILVIFVQCLLTKEFVRFLLDISNLGGHVTS